MSSHSVGQVSTAKENNAGIVKVKGSFAFQIQADFRKAYEALSDGCTLIKVDLAEADYMDSSGLGMLLVMKKYLSENKIDFEIIRSSGQTYELLKMTHFHQYFRINGEETGRVPA